MELVVPLGGVRKNGVTETESRALELHSNAWIGLWIVAIVVAVLLQTDAVLLHDLVAHNNGQKFIVGNVLNLRKRCSMGALE